MANTAGGGVNLFIYLVGIRQCMASKINYMKGLGIKNLDPGQLTQGVDLTDVHVGIVHGPSGTQYNKMAVPWAGGVYVVMPNGDIEKIGGRDGAVEGDAIDQFGNLGTVWRNFAQAQRNQRQTGEMNRSFEQLIAELESVASNLSRPGQQGPGEGTSLRAKKVQRVRGRPTGGNGGNGGNGGVPQGL